MTELPEPTLQSPADVIIRIGGAVWADGGFAELLRTPERSVLKLPSNLAPADLAPRAPSADRHAQLAGDRDQRLPGVVGERDAIAGAGGATPRLWLAGQEHLVETLGGWDRL